MKISQNFNRRHSPNRRKTRVEAAVEVDGIRLVGFVVNVSFDGMQLALPHNLQPGSPITIEFLNHRIPAIVHWSKARHAGVHLLERLEGQTLIELESAEDDLADYR